jgi:diguanylate cyclase (GGDEF)-like protein
MIQRFAKPGEVSGERLEGNDGGGDKWHLENTIYEHLALAISNIRLRELLLQQSTRDPLTGLFNRRYMEVSFTRELARAERKKAPLGVIMFDVDHFKRFNDTYGHMAGDMVLKRIAEITLHKTRKTDIVCRYGGEEFTIVMPEAALGDVVVRAEQLRISLEQADKLVVDGQELPPSTISLGVAVYPDHGAELADLLGKADEALYQAKKEGRNQVKVAG